MATTRFPRYSKVPDISTRKSSPTTTNFAKGINTYKPNDKMALDELHLAQDARFDRIGEYKTRKGMNQFSVPVGKTEIYNNYGAEYDMVPVDPADTYFMTLNLAMNTVIYSITLKILQNTSDYGILQVNLVNRDGDILATACVDPDSVNAVEQDVEVVFTQAPDTIGEIGVQLRPQFGGTNNFEIAEINGGLMCKVNNATKGRVTSIFEANLSDSTGSLTDKSILFTFAPAGDNTGNETLYRLAENGTLTNFTTLKTDGHPVRYSQDASIIRCIFGKGLVALNPTGVGEWGWEVSTIPTLDLETDVDLQINLANILSGPEDNLLYFDRATTTQMVWTWPYGGQYVAPASFSTTTEIPKYDADQPQPQLTTINKSDLTAVNAEYPVSQIKIGDFVVYYKDIQGDEEKGEFYGRVTTVNTNTVIVASDPHIAEVLNSYDKFDRDFRQNFPTINSGDPLTAMVNLAGIVYIFTERHKYQISFEEADVWTQAKCSADGGTFSQESVASSPSYAYFANRDGIYVFDGFNEESLTKKSIQNVYDAIPNKEQIRLEIYGNRLYAFCPDEDNSKSGICLVYNLNLGLWESFDTEIYVGATCAAKSPSGRFICGHNRMGMLMLAETASNKHDDMGAPLHFELDTAYQHYGTPSQKKRITKWRPEFACVKVPYSVQCGYALDGTDDVRYAYSINLQNNYTIDEQYVWDYPSNYGVETVPTRMTTIPRIYNEFRRCQIRYQHIAAFEPVNFKSHTLTIQTQRIR